MNNNNYIIYKPYLFKKYDLLTLSEKKDLHFLDKYDLSKLYDYNNIDSPKINYNDIIYLSELFINNFYHKDISYILSIIDWQKEFFKLYTKNRFNSLINEDKFHLAPVKNIISLLNNFLFYLNKLDKYDKKNYLLYIYEDICKNLLVVAHIKKNKKYKRDILNIYYEILNFCKNSFQNQILEVYYKIIIFYGEKLSFTNNKDIRFLINEISKEKNFFLTQRFYLLEKHIIWFNFQNNQKLIYFLLNKLNCFLFWEQININLINISYVNKNYIENLKLLLNYFFNNNVYNKKLISKKIYFILLNIFNKLSLSIYDNNIIDIYQINNIILSKLINDIKNINNKNKLLAIYEKKYIQNNIEDYANILIKKINKI